MKFRCTLSIIYMKDSRLAALRDFCSLILTKAPRFFFQWITTQVAQGKLKRKKDSINSNWKSVITFIIGGDNTKFYYKLKLLYNFRIYQ